MKEIPKFYHVDDLKDYYIRSSQGHWFDKGTMRFFNTRLTSHFKKIDDMTYYFITTEKGPSGIRKATIRQATLSENDSFYGFKVNIETLGEFNSMTLAQAVYQFKKLTNKVG